VEARGVGLAAFTLYNFATGKKAVGALSLVGAALTLWRFLGDS
jgi:hypothetical protein